MKHLKRFNESADEFDEFEAKKTNGEDEDEKKPALQVKIGDNIYDANEEPIMLIFADDDLRASIAGQISDMEEGATKYVQYPEEMEQEDVEAFMNTDEEPEESEETEKADDDETDDDLNLDEPANEGKSEMLIDPAKQRKAIETAKGMLSKVSMMQNLPTKLKDQVLATMTAFSKYKVK